MQIRILSVQRTNQKFDARNATHTRTYQYYLPLDALSPGNPGAPMIMCLLCLPHRPGMSWMRDWLLVAEGAIMAHKAP